MKILVPTDFSIIARHAFKYALKYGEKFNAEFVLFHSDNTPKPTYSFINKLDDIIETEAKKTLTELANSVQEEVDINSKVTCVFRFGDTVSSITEYCDRNDIDLIIMGTKGESVIENKIFGSIASGVMEESSCPTLLVPRKSNLDTPKNITYASDLTNIDEEIKNLIPIAKAFDATIHTVHIFPEVIDGNSFDAERERLHLIAMSDYEKLNFNAVMDYDIIRGLNKYAQEVGSDFLAMYTHKSSILEQLFNDSFTQEMALHNEVPLLVMSKNL